MESAKFISEGVEIVDVSLFLKKEKILVIPDLHIGYEEALNKQGVLVPRVQYKETFQRLKKILEKVKPKKVIVIGDIKHEFGTISETEWRHTLEVLDLFGKYADEIFLIKGNHDTIIGPIARKRKVKVVDFVTVGDIFFCHGDAVLENDAFKNSKRVIIGHEHPAVTLEEGAKQETFKCFLKGKFKRKELIAMPSFNLLPVGTNVLKRSLLSPFLEQSLKNFEVFVIEDKPYYFGKVKDLVS